MFRHVPCRPCALACALLKEARIAQRCAYIYIYIEREREREINVYIYIYIYICTHGVNTNGAAAKVNNFDRLGKKERPGTFVKIRHR